MVVVILLPFTHQHRGPAGYSCRAVYFSRPLGRESREKCELLASPEYPSGELVSTQLPGHRVGTCSLEACSYPGRIRSGWRAALPRGPLIEFPAWPSRRVKYARRLATLACAMVT